ncbi:MAG: hemolysin family protein [candidate division WOR-3 bacterium]|nr:hemolysin family protein [candidate division WOR-3 bacterium]MDH5683878.1 hemolysin family protein [candidate division WOR-3 bacterium]
MLWYLTIVIICLFFSALFSGSETALFSISKIVLAQLKEAKRKNISRIEHLLSNPPRLLGTILLSNLLVNITASSVFTLLVVAFSRYYGLAPDLYLGIGAVMMTGLLLVFGEVTPKVWAAKRPVSFATFSSSLIVLLSKLFSPLVNLLSHLGFTILRRAKQPTFPTDEELMTMIEIGKEQGTISAAEEEILHNLLELDKRTASEVMTPRIEIDGMEKNMRCEQAVEFAKKTGFSRFPVYEGSVDNVVGIVYVKDLLTSIGGINTVDEIKRPAYFVPEVKKLSFLLEELRKKGSHIAIVVDEFGQTAGLVTLEDILEAIFGEITDEYDLQEELPYFKLDEKNYLVDGEIDLRTLNRIFRRAFKGLDYERLSGFIHAQLNRLPKVGDSFTFRRLYFEIKNVSKNRIEQVLIRKS